MRERSALLWRAGFVAAAGFVVYVARTRGPYHFDDWVTPVSDPASQSLSAFGANVTRTLRPLSKLGFAIEASLGLGAEPALRRAVSAAFHAVSSGLLFLIAARMRAGLWAAGVGALLYAVHPIHAEMVWSLAGRGAVMATMFLLAAVLAQLRRRTWLAGGLLAAACLSRETAILGFLPLAALELARRRGDWGAVFRRLEPSLTVALLAVAFVVQNARYRQLMDYSAHGRPYAWSVAAQIAAIPRGLFLYVSPSSLSIDHGEAISHSLASGMFWFGIATYLLLLVAIHRGIVRRRTALAVGAAIVLAALLPTQSVIPKLDALTERPFASALAGVALLGSVAWRRAAAAVRWRRIWLGASACLVVFFVQATLARGKLYTSDITLWRDAADKSAVNPRPHYNLALALLEQGRVSEAAVCLRRARQIDPFDSEMRSLAAQLELGLSSAGSR